MSHGSKVSHVTAVLFATTQFIKHSQAKFALIYCDPARMRYLGMIKNVRPFRCGIIMVNVFYAD